MFNVWILFCFFQGPPLSDCGHGIEPCVYKRITAIDIHVHRNGEGRISFYPASYSMTKARTPKSRCIIFLRVEGTPCFSSSFAVVVSKHLAMKKKPLNFGWSVAFFCCCWFCFMLACNCPNLVEYNQFERVKCEIESGKTEFFLCSIDFDNSFLFRWGFPPGFRFLHYS